MIDHWQTRIRSQFGSHAGCEGPLAASGAGLRLTGFDLCDPLEPEQATCLLDALSQFRVLSIAGQDLARFSLAQFERFANHWGAPVPHPNNFLRDGKHGQSDSASDGELEWTPPDQRDAAAVNRTFPGELQCLPHRSPAVLVIANFRGPRKEDGGANHCSRGGPWHTDIEYEPLPIYVSMMLVHAVPTAREAPGGTWVAPLHADADDPGPYFEGSAPELIRLRRTLPLNGETAFADTAGAFAALPAAERAELEQLQVRRRLNAPDPGWLAPLVRTDPRSGLKALHSPIWASRPRARPPIEVDGMSPEQSRALLDRLEMHVLQPQFRYDHVHTPGDVTIWHNYMTLHAATPLKLNVQAVADARLIYRISCKGAPAPVLPRADDPAWLHAHVPGSYQTPPGTLGLS
jgi:alpha-ketoglutarate-dependent taurine dioxygenase